MNSGMVEWMDRFCVGKSEVEDEVDDGEVWGVEKAAWKIGVSRSRIMSSKPLLKTGILTNICWCSLVVVSWSSGSICRSVMSDLAA